MGQNIGLSARGSGGRYSQNKGDVATAHDIPFTRYDGTSMGKSNVFGLAVVSIRGCVLDIEGRASWVGTCEAGMKAFSNHELDPTCRALISRR
jgi:hypothetical protein